MDVCYKLWWKNYFVVFLFEIFVKIKDGWIYFYFMKGMLFGYLLVDLLFNDLKEQVEYVIIVDFICNDLSQVVYKVQVVNYCYVEYIVIVKGGFW